MKTMKLYKIAGVALLCLGSVASCTTESMFDAVGDESAIAVPGGEGGNTSAGVLTAGEWNDLDHWDFWGKLFKDEDITKASKVWEFNVDKRIAVKVTDAAGKAVSGARVEATMGSKIVWSTVTDNHGTANLWLNLFDGKELDDDAVLKVRINGKEQSGTPVISYPQDGDAKVNSYKASQKADIENSVDVAFVVDATGSMEDEIRFLQDDIEDIIGKASAINSASIRTGAIFYRDEEDEYVTRSSQLTAKTADTREFIRHQSAYGGGDYPEAVHTALEATLQELDWNVYAKSRIAFLILDAPAHLKTKVVESLHKSIEKFADMGIIIIPVAASGADLQTEFMLRNFAIVTNGTYTFLTNDSGVGGDHLEPRVGEFEVEKLNELMTRLISHYME